MFIVQLILFQVFIFAVLVIALRHVIGMNATKASEQMQGLSDEYIKKEQEIRKEKEELDKKSSEIISLAKKEAIEIRGKAEEEMREESARILDKARQESEQIVERAERCAEQTKKEVDDHIDREAVKKASSMIGDILPEDIKKEAHERWTNDLIGSGFNALDRMNIPEDIATAVISTPFVLDDNIKKRIAAELKGHLKRDITLKVEKVPSLVAGIVVAVGNVVLDGSLANKAEKLGEEGR